MVRAVRSRRRSAHAARPEQVHAPGRAPARAAEVEKHLAELKRHATLLFGGVLPLGSDAMLQVLSLQSALALAPKSDGSADREATRVLDLLLRLSEGIGASSGFARSLRGAASAFAARGFESTRIEHILAAGGVSPRTFYQLFRNKHEVLDALAELFLSVLLELCRREVQRDGEPSERLRRFARVLVGGLAVVERMARIVIGEAVRPGGPLEPLYERFLTEMTAMLSPVYGALPGASDEGELRVRLLAVMGAAFELRLDSHSRPEQLRRAEELFVDLLTPRSLAGAS